AAAHLRLRVVADRCLNRLPFAALHPAGSGGFLIERHALVLAPALDTAPAEPISASGPAPASALLVADPAAKDALAWLPPLTGARAEIAAARRLFRAPLVLEGDAATASRVLSALGSARIFIFAGHAVSNTIRPSESYLVVAPEPGHGSTGLL